MQLNDISKLLSNYFSKQGASKQFIIKNMPYGSHFCIDGRIKELASFEARVKKRIGNSNNAHLTKNEIDELVKILDKQWQKIKNTKLSYTQNFENDINKVYVSLAKLLGKELNKNPYALLMPTIANADMKKTPLLRQKFSEYDINECLLTTDNYLIPIPEILSQYKDTYRISNFITGKPYSKGDLLILRNHPLYSRKFSKLERVVSELSTGYSTATINAIESFISALLKDSPNVAELAFVELSEYIESLPDLGKKRLMETKISKWQTFSDVYTKLATEDTCSHVIIRNSLQPLVQRLKTYAEEDRHNETSGQKIIM